LVAFPIVVQEQTKNLLVFDYLDTNGNCSEKLIQFADLIKSPEEVSTFEISSYSLWTAAAKGVVANDVIDYITYNSQNNISDKFLTKIREDIMAFGSLEFVSDGETLTLIGTNKEIIDRIKQIDSIYSRISTEPTDTTITFHIRYKTEIKKILFDYDLFIKDSTVQVGDFFDFNLLPIDITGNPIILTDFQQDAIDAYLKYCPLAGGGGTIVMPPSSGKTIAAFKIMETLKIKTLIIAENTSSVERWLDEFHTKTDVSDENIAVFVDSHSIIKPITIGTYSNLSQNLHCLGNFGLIIYDDAHKIPTENNVITTSIESNYKLALAATLARSDNNGKLVLSLVGPKWYEILPRTLIEKGYQVPVKCYEIRVPLPPNEQVKYASKFNTNHERRKIAALNSLKLNALENLVKQFDLNRILILSYRIEQSDIIGQKFDIPVINSQTHQNEKIIEQFNNDVFKILISTSQIIEKKKIQRLDILISTSYQQGSIREEYLRLGKVLSKESGKDEGILISLISKNTIEEKDYSTRRRSLINQGFRFNVLSFENI
jgi:DNA excision repair protein ERCC-3